MKKQKLKKFRNRARVAYQPIAGLGFELRLSICFLQTPSPASFPALGSSTTMGHFTEDSRFDPCFKDVFVEDVSGCCLKFRPYSVFGKGEDFKIHKEGRFLLNSKETFGAVVCTATEFCY